LLRKHLGSKKEKPYGKGGKKEGTEDNRGREKI